jgi:hypothetical protein
MSSNPSTERKKKGISYIILYSIFGGVCFVFVLRYWGLNSASNLEAGTLSLEPHTSSPLFERL